MKSIILPGLALLFSGILMLMHLIGQPITSRSSIDQQSSSLSPSFALVELFTSQGCSSCPPADRVLEEIGKKAEENGQPVYTLSFHVDYWNYLGWKDPYSDARFSDRQRRYAEVLASSVYTPQMVVNGQTAFVGSRQQEAQHYVKQALSTPSEVGIQLTSTLEEGEASVRLNYELSTHSNNWILHVALVEDQLTDKVTRGENRNRTLSHHGVVREFSSQPVSGVVGSMRIPLEKLKDVSQGKLIAYVQEKEGLTVRGATQLSLR